MARLILWGNAISPGIAIGPLRLKQSIRLLEKRRIVAEDVAKEEEALVRAAEQVRSALGAAVREVPETLQEYREIMLSQMELARDPKIIDSARARIRRRKICATWALNETMEELCNLFSGIEDPYLQDRAQDIKAICFRIADALTGASHEKDTENKSILASYELSPADVMELGPNGILGLLTVEGGPTSHTAILARGMRVPAIAGMTDLLAQAREGETVIVDALRGCALLAPDGDDLEKYQEFRENYLAFENQTKTSATLSSATKDGIELVVGANLENLSELGTLKKSGARGIGLYRTEYAYLGGALPDEKALVEEYSTVLAKTAPEKVIFRTLDVGADKLLLPNIIPNEPNPALGLRGIRFCLKYRDIFRTQLRAVLRASRNSNAALMLPMISGKAEIAETREIISSVKEELKAEGLAYAKDLPLGIMIETPSAVLASDILAGECDFFSIGTNDLVHYLLAIDRNNRHVAYLNEPLHPAIIRSLKTVIDAAHANNITASVCGELASDPCGIVVLLGLGIDELSAAQHFVPAIKHILRKLDAGLCADLVNEILTLHDVAEVKKLLEAAMVNFLGPELPYHSSSFVLRKSHE